jgi:hypothetical protein
MLAEDLLASKPGRLAALDGLISTAISQTERQPNPGTDDDVIRLRLVRAEYDRSERRQLLQAARRHQVPVGSPR